MSELKNHYGENVGWFCYEASLIDADFQHDDLIPDVLEIICDNGGSIDVDVRKLFESAHVAMEEQQAKIKQLEHDKERLALLLKELLFLDAISPVSTRKIVKSILEECA
ncbi:hypothetical protein ABVY18_004151 [Vibrio parahaemolyticus]|nr:hypothetical protein [Vibrio parahaemolyticus]EGR3062782.1 hypothetical protein [Vibrio parahaemolyticus]EGR3072929.1 hypothetical protein [Vibrio parahaemolyticus]EGR3174421.1 hypothetical protein [Vibrio parahaemolyticus]EJC6906646.1 hypothetical protein [Vibrio parahaemolyticus]